MAVSIEDVTPLTTTAVAKGKRLYVVLEIVTAAPPGISVWPATRNPPATDVITGAKFVEVSRGDVTPLITTAVAVTGISGIDPPMRPAVAGSGDVVPSMTIAVAEESRLYVVPPTVIAVPPGLRLWSPTR